MRQTETIASVATGMTDAGIGIIRISGDAAVACAERITERPLSGLDPNTIRFNRILDETGRALDEVLVSVLRAPHSYTGEDTVEINTHGGRLVMESVLERLLKAGKGKVRLAEPGEFTKRAFLNGRIDLTMAEAVQDIICAKTVFAVQNAAAQLGGALALRIREMREKLLHESAFIEAALDDPDVYGEALESYGETLLSVINAVQKQIHGLLEGYDEGILRKDGISCAIIGPPNAGKSTLLNLLSKTDRAIVTDIPGTTRDVIEETVRIGELLLRVQDTAGIREARDDVEKIGIERAKERAMRAELILLVLDVCGYPEQDAETLLSLAGEKQVVVLLNKTDLVPDDVTDRIRNRLKERHGKTLTILPVSLLRGHGTDALKQVLEQMFFSGALVEKEEVYLTNLRQKEALAEADESLEHVKDAIRNTVSEDFYVADLMDAYEALGRITGEAIEDDLADKIFSAFCLGK